MLLHVAALISRRLNHAAPHPQPTIKAMPVFVEEGVLALERILINGGRRGYLVGIAPQVLTDVLHARPVHCAL